MGSGTAGLLQFLALVVALVATYRPLGDYMARVFTSDRHLRAERFAFRGVGVDPDSEQTWPTYLRSLLAFSAVSLIFLYLFQRLQQHLLLSLGFPPHTTIKSLQRYTRCRGCGVRGKGDISIRWGKAGCRIAMVETEAYI